MPSPRAAAFFGALGAGPLAWAALRAASAHPELVEDLYSRGAFPWLAAAAGALPRLVPFGVAEPLAALLVAAAGALAFRFVRNRPGRRLRASAFAALGLLAAASAIAAGVVALFALNASRQRVATLYALAPAPREVAELEALGAELEAEAAALRAGIAEDARGVHRAPSRAALLDVAAGFAELETRVGWPRVSLPAPRPAWLSPLLTRFGISGIYIPFTAEPLVNGGAPDHELPFTAAHELAHQRGFAREDEASFLAFLACRAHPSPDVRYSAAMEAADLVGVALWQAGEDGRAALQRVRRRETEAMRRDRAASRAFWSAARGPVHEAARRVNDAFIRGTGQEAGVRTYGLAVDLMLAWRAAAPR
jgi:hypothetical protein